MSSSKGLKEKGTVTTATKCNKKDKSVAKRKPKLVPGGPTAMLFEGIDDGEIKFRNLKFKSV